MIHHNSREAGFHRFARALVDVDYHEQHALLSRNAILRLAKMPTMRVGSELHPNMHAEMLLAVRMSMHMVSEHSMYLGLPMTAATTHRHTLVSSFAPPRRKIQDQSLKHGTWMSLVLASMDLLISPVSSCHHQELLPCCHLSSAVRRCFANVARRSNSMARQVPMAEVGIMRPLVAGHVQWRLRSNQYGVLPSQVLSSVES